MDVRKCWPDISRMSKAFNTRNKFIFPNIHVLFCLLYKKIVLLPHKNRAENFNALHDNRHKWDYRFYQWRKIVKINKQVYLDLSAMCNCYRWYIQTNSTLDWGFHEKEGKTTPCWRHELYLQITKMDLNSRWRQDIF